MAGFSGAPHDNINSVPQTPKESSLLRRASASSHRACRARGGGRSHAQASTGAGSQPQGGPWTLRTSRLQGRRGGKARPETRFLMWAVKQGQVGLRCVVWLH